MKHIKNAVNGVELLLPQLNVQICLTRIWEKLSTPSGDAADCRDTFTPPMHLDFDDFSLTLETNGYLVLVPLLIWDSSSGTPHLGLVIWDSSSGTPHLGLLIWDSSSGTPHLGLLISDWTSGTPHLGLLILDSSSGTPHLGLLIWASWVLAS